MAILTASQLTGWSQLCYSVSVGGTFVEQPVARPDLEQLAPCRGVCGAMICCFGKGEDNDNEKKWEVIKNV